MGLSNIYENLFPDPKAENVFLLFLSMQTTTCPGFTTDFISFLSSTEHEISTDYKTKILKNKYFLASKRSDLIFTYILQMIYIIITLFLASKFSYIVFILLINVKMPTIVSI